MTESGTRGLYRNQFRGGEAGSEKRRELIREGGGSRWRGGKLLRSPRPSKRTPTNLPPPTKRKIPLLPSKGKMIMVKGKKKKMAISVLKKRSSRKPMADP